MSALSSPFVKKAGVLPEFQLQSMAANLAARHERRPVVEQDASRSDGAFGLIKRLTQLLLTALEPGCSATQTYAEER
jgi:hypothetical protein